MISYWVGSDGTQHLHLSGWWREHIRHMLLMTQAGSSTELIHPDGHRVVVSQRVHPSPAGGVPVPLDLTEEEVRKGK